MMVDDDYHENLTPNRVRQIAEGAEVMACLRARSSPATSASPRRSTLKGYRDGGGYKGLAKALKMEPDEVIDEVKKSGLRGRGGAGFSAGMKWSFIPKGEGQARSTWSATPTSPSRAPSRTALLMEYDPHQLIEGCAICCYAIGCSTCYIYIRGEYTKATEILEARLKEAYAAGILGENILGSRLQARHVRPPRRRRLHLRRGDGPARVAGGQARPAARQAALPRRRRRLRRARRSINNVETLACVPHIIDARRRLVQGDRHRREEHRPEALLRSPATSSSPGIYEFPMGITFRELLDGCGGMLEGAASSRRHPRRRLGADAHGRRDRHQARLRRRRQGRLDARLGGVIVMDDTTCMVALGRAPREVLRPRVLRPVHALPRGDELAGADPRPHRARRGPRARRRSCSRSCRQHRRQVPLRPRRRRHRPGASLVKKFRDEIDQHIKRAGPARSLHRRYFAERSVTKVPKVTINDRTVEVEAGTNLVDAAIKAGVQIPHYCYHPRLSVVGQCRMCLVKIERHAEARRPAAPPR